MLSDISSHLVDFSKGKENAPREKEEIWTEIQLVIKNAKTLNGSFKKEFLKVHNGNRQHFEILSIFGTISFFFFNLFEIIQKYIPGDSMKICLPEKDLIRDHISKK